MFNLQFFIANYSEEEEEQIHEDFEMRFLWRKERHRGTAFNFFCKMIASVEWGSEWGERRWSCLVTACHNTGRSGGSHHWVEEDRAQLPSRHAGHQSPVSCLLSPDSYLLSPVLSGQGLWLNCSCRRQRKRYQNLSNINTLFPFLTKVEKVRPTNININFLTFWLYLSEEMAWKRLVTIWPWLIHSALKIKTFYFFTFKIQIQG